MIALAKPQLNSIDEVIHGEALTVLRTLPDNSVDAIVCDPPAGISFMGKDWDKADYFPYRDRSAEAKRSGREEKAAHYGLGYLKGNRVDNLDYSKKGRDAFISFLTLIMAEALRVLKPGGHAFVWALPRTSHWTGMALEDAGFEVKDAVFHHFGSGFPKSKNLGNGLGTALKPSTEIWWLCRKPLSEKSIAENVLKWGTGAINIDASRVGHNEPLKTTERTAPRYSGNTMNNGVRGGIQSTIASADPQGRWPSNLLLSHSVWCVPNGVKKVKGTASGYNWEPSNNDNPTHIARNIKSGVHYGDEEVDDWLCDESCPVRLLDEQSGMRKSNARANCEGKPYATYHREIYGAYNGERPLQMYYDQGGSSRYFQRFAYVPKASRAERNRGCEGLPEVERHTLTGDTRPSRVDGARRNDHQPAKPQANTHPTVKSIALMRYLVRMITPPGGIVLDCFAGSGSTLVAAIHEGMHFIGIEMNDSEQEPYVTIARARIEQAFREVQS